MRGLPKNIYKLGFLSLFTDMSSEMIFPLLPALLSSLPGGGPFVLGIIEGFAGFTASALKLVSGFWTDRIKKRTPFIVAGYGIASFVRPFIAFATVWPTVLVLRFFDRVGKGLRSSPRDAMIAESVSAGQRGSAFGLQRIMDHTGAVFGPVIVFALMGMWGFSVRQVILFAAVPSALVLILLSTLREPAKPTPPVEKVPQQTSQTVLSRDYRLLLTSVFVFTLGNSTDAFLLLRLSNVGVATGSVALLWGFHHIFKIIGAWLGGKFSDSAGRKTLMLIGLGFYIMIYAAFGMFDSNYILMGVFIVYGISIGILEPIERAWVSELSQVGKHGSAFGIYHAVIGFGALPASLLFGILWHRFGPMTAFLTGAALAAVSAGIVTVIRDNRQQTHEN